MAVYAHVLEPCSHLLEDPQRRSGPHPDCYETIVKSWIVVKTEEMVLLRGLYWLLGHVLQPGRHDIWTKATDEIRGLQQPTKLTELKLFMGVWTVFEWFVANLAP